MEGATVARSGAMQWRAAMNYGARGVTIGASEPGRRSLYGDALDHRPTPAAAPTTSYRRGQPMRIASGSDECWGRILCGAARSLILQDNARRRIIDFLLPGDLLEPAAFGRGFDLEAVCDNTVMAVHRVWGAKRAAPGDPYVPREMHELSLAMASRFRRQILILGHSTAMGKLCAFLLEMQQRSAHPRSDTIVLPMSRYDIADYLAISVETVSRNLTILQARKVIKQIHKREIRVLDRDALEHGWSTPGDQFE